MRLFILGSGAREHALAWRLRQDAPAAEIFAAPGNAGTAALGTNLPLAATDVPALVAWAGAYRPGLTVVGSEAPLCAGVVDAFEQAGLPIFGPSQSAALLEGSKVFTKALLQKYHLPTAAGAAFTGMKEALAYSARQAYPQVIKADGLAAGKGVIIAGTAAEAERAIRQIMEERVFGAAGAALLLEDFLPGREMSVHLVTDGISYTLLPISQDHKRRDDGDRGPNTGGMGAYAPAPFVTPEIRTRIVGEVVEPVLQALREEGLDFRGILYIGLIWTAAGPQILEFNVRGGDPETQVLLPLLATPLLELLEAVRSRRLAELKVRWHDRHAVTVVMAARNYPETPVTGDLITGLEAQTAGTFVFHGGTKLEGDRVVTAGGRVLSVTAWGDSLDGARAAAYARVAQIDFAGCQYRRDIAARVSLE